MNKILIYGKAGAGKTNFLKEMAKYIKKSTGKKTRIITADGGGIEPFKASIDLGFVDAVDISNWANPFATFQYLSSGWWPTDPDTVNSPLQNGFNIWKMCPFCKGESGAPPLGGAKECSSCKKAFPVGTLLKTVREPRNGMEDVGGYGFEGLTSWGDRCQQLQSDKLAQGDPGASAGGSDSSKGGSSLRFQDGVDPDGKPVMVAGNAMPHYGASVDYLNRYVRNSDQLPGWKCWTALERVGTEEETKKKLVGPSVPGRAGVEKVIAWFNSVLHLEMVEGSQDKDGTVKVERKVYLSTHYSKDAPGVPNLAKLSTAYVEGLPSVIEPSFSEFMKVLDTAKKRDLDKLTSELAS